MRRSNNTIQLLELLHHIFAKSINNIWKMLRWTQCVLCVLCMTSLLHIQCHADQILFYVGSPDLDHHRYMKNLAGEMKTKNHTVSLLMSSAYEEEEGNVAVKKGFVFQSPFTAKDLSWMYTIMASWGTMGESKPSTSTDQMRCTGVAREICITTPRELTISNLYLANCHGLLQDEDVLSKIKSAKFDFYVADPSDLCSVILAQCIDVPYAFAVPTSIENGRHDVWTQLPSPSAYVPHLSTGFDDDMTLWQRVINTLISTFVTPFGEWSFRRPYEELKNKFGIKPEQDLREAMLWTEIWLFNVHFTFDFPRPLMPNVVPVGGLVTKEAGTLSKKWQKLIDNSSASGVVLVSFGSLIDLSLMPDLGEMLAKTFAKLPQTIIWKYSGEPPRGLGENTILVKDFPQNDLLGHPKVRAYVTHGESSNLHEAVYHERPMVVLPFYTNQWLNSKVVESRCVGRRVLQHDISEKKIFAALVTAMTDPKIKSNIEELSFAFRDNFRHPLNAAGLWLNHVIKFRGDHLRPVVHELYTFQYYLLDVGLFLLCLLLLPFVLTFFLVRCMCRCLMKIPQKLIGSTIEKEKHE